MRPNAKFMKILVSIINWNNTRATNNCLSGISRLPKAVQPDIIVADNHSTEVFKIDPKLKQSLKSLKVTRNDRNLGFAGGHNPNIELAYDKKYDYIFLLNNDVEIIDVDLFKKLAEALENNPRALGANPTILSSVDPDIVWYGGGRLSLVTGYASHQGVGSRMGAGIGPSREVTLLTGGCLAINLRRAKLDILKLPEEYFVYWEDTAWCAKAQKAGYKLLYVPEAKLLHRVSSSLGVYSPAYIYYNIRNHLIFVRRNISWAYWPLGWMRALYISMKYIANILFRYRQARLKALRAVWYGWIDGTVGHGVQLERKL
jgi:GT2 family glycosyltransferase